MYFAVVTRRDNNGIYVVGNVGGDLDSQTFGGGTSDIVIFKYASDGTKLWTRLIGNSGDETAYAGAWI